jgi:hypothetical protein
VINWEITHPEDHGTLDNSANRDSSLFEASHDIVKLGNITLQQIDMRSESFNILDYTSRPFIVVSASGYDRQVLCALLGEVDGKTATQTLQSTDDQVADIRSQL